MIQVVNPESLRAKYRPDHVSVLFVGESPPAGGTFFYAANSILYRATEEAFRDAVPDLLNEGAFLGAFNRMGCFLVDLCLEPVNHLSMKDPVQLAERLTLRTQGEPRLAELVAALQPEVIVGVLMSIGPNIRAAMTLAEVRTKLCELPFPRPEHVGRFRRELSELVKDFRRRGFLTGGD